jgi:hypothetical protein
VLEAAGDAEPARDREKLAEIELLPLVGEDDDALRMPNRPAS